MREENKNKESQKATNKKMTDERMREELNKNIKKAKSS